MNDDNRSVEEIIADLKLRLDRREWRRTGAVAPRVDDERTTDEIIADLDRILDRREWRRTGAVAPRADDGRTFEEIIADLDRILDRREWRRKMATARRVRNGRQRQRPSATVLQFPSAPAADPVPEPDADMSDRERIVQNLEALHRGNAELNELLAPLRRASLSVVGTDRRRTASSCDDPTTA